MRKALQITAAAGLLLATECTADEPEQMVQPEPVGASSFWSSLSPEVMRVLDENTVRMDLHLQPLQGAVQDLATAELETAYFLEPFGVPGTPQIEVDELKELDLDSEIPDGVLKSHTEDFLLTHVKGQFMEWNVYEFLGKDEDGPVFKADTDGNYCSRLTADLEGYYDVNGTPFYAVKESNAGEFLCPPLDQLNQQQ